tara:strand:- start:1607 stop:2644 length:1038 start_codon:yes stop_codon:yes gene_type:complete
MDSCLTEIFDNKTIFISGGTGSFGNAVINKLISLKVKEVRIFSRDEKKQDDMRRKYQNEKVTFRIGDVRDYKTLYNAMEDVDFVFHAAALKQVPSCEFFPMEAVKTNIMGTENILDASIRRGVKKVVCLSTDKAVYPVNAMGMTKALMEKICVSKSRESKNTIIATTRFGNVMASRGSVIPLFCEQISKNKPLTITNPKMTRFMMFLEDAVDLVIYAFNNASHGDLFVQKSPAASLENISNAIFNIFNIDRSFKKLIGTRIGEKLYEVLISREEMINSIDKGKYFLVPAKFEEKKYINYFDQGNINLNNNLEYTSNNTYQLNIEELIALFSKLDVVNMYLNKRVP